MSECAQCEDLRGINRTLSEKLRAINDKSKQPVYAVVGMVQAAGQLFEKFIGMAHSLAEVEHLIDRDLTGPSPSKHWLVYRKERGKKDRRITVAPQTENLTDALFL